MMSDYRLSYIAATIALAISALSKTFTYILLRFFADDVLGQKKYIGELVDIVPDVDRIGIYWSCRL